MSSEPHSPAPERPWWETRPFVAFLIMLSVIPLLYPPVPPLVDLLGHMGRYRVQLELGTSPFLANYYGFDWAPIGNLGIDVLIWPVAKLFGLEFGTKLIVMMIPPMTVAGFLWVAREVHHRLPPTVMFALPFAYSHPFMFGFTNFALAMALAFLAFGLWLRLARLDRTTLRAILFAPISFVIFFTHTFGWGMLGLLAFSAEAVRQHDRGIGWIRSGFKAAAHAMAMALPAFVILAWRSEVDGAIARKWFDWGLKWEGFIAVLRDRWYNFDMASLWVVILVLLFALFNRRLTYSRNLAFSALVLAAVFVILPWQLFQSAYADMRLAPFMFAVALLAIRFKSDTHMPTARVLAVLGLAFFLIRLGGNTLSLGMEANRYAEVLPALDKMPMGSRVVTLAGKPCGRTWALARNSHIGAMVIVRKHGFSNDQWVIKGMNLLSLRYKDAGIFKSDPSGIVRPNQCSKKGWWIDRALRAVPRRGFDYVWLIDPFPYNRNLVEGMKLVWSAPGSELYQVNPSAEAPPAATRQKASAPGR